MINDGRNGKSPAGCKEGAKLRGATRRARGCGRELQAGLIGCRRMRSSSGGRAKRPLPAPFGLPRSDEPDRARQSQTERPLRSPARAASSLSLIGTLPIVSLLFCLTLLDCRTALSYLLNYSEPSRPPWATSRQPDIDNHLSISYITSLRLPVS
ncbi:hypothetical protein BC834DRAFT_23358 [Gloeopeniophorella convolvens]|nr:hypothetical protein BC834DRAFT_23358 [Gloeopeniophorella convolvens]